MTLRLLILLLLWAAASHGFTVERRRTKAAPSSSTEESRTMTSKKGGTTNISVMPARIPQDLDGIRACRGAAFDNKDKDTLLNAQKRFIHASNVEEGRTTCLVARHPRQPKTILGTAEVNLKTQKKDGTTTISSASVCNVFVLPDARGLGIGKELMLATEDFVKAKKATAVSPPSLRLTLQVYTNNTPAYMLYKRLDYQTRGVNGLVAGLGEATGMGLFVEMVKDV